MIYKDIPSYLHIISNILNVFIKYYKKSIIVYPINQTLYSFIAESFKQA